MAGRGRGLLKSTRGPLRDRRGSVSPCTHANAFRSRPRERTVFDFIQHASMPSHLQILVPIGTVLLGLSLGILPSVTAAAPATNPPPNKNILLITVDTLRADHLGCYGYKRIKTPHMDQL